MGIKFPGEVFTPQKPDLENLESFDNTIVGGVEKFGSVSSDVVALSDVVAKAGDTMTGQLIINNGGLQLSSEIYLNRTSVAASYSTVAKDIYIGVTNTDSARTITLSSVDTEDKRIIIVNDESGGAGTNNITVDTQGAQTIDGAASVAIATNYGSVRLISDGTNWFTW